MKYSQSEFDFGFPPYVNRDTSEEAAESIEPHTSRLAKAVFGFIVFQEGATCWEVEQQLVMRHQTASARIRELTQNGFIEDSGERRLTGSGRRAIVWKIKPKATGQTIPALVSPKSILDSAQATQEKEREQ